MRLLRFVIDDPRAFMLVGRGWAWILRAPGRGYRPRWTGKPARLRPEDTELYAWGPGVIHHLRIGLAQETGRGGMGVSCPVCRARHSYWCDHEENEGLRPILSDDYTGDQF